MVDSQAAKLTSILSYGVRWNLKPQCKVRLEKDLFFMVNFKFRCRIENLDLEEEKSSLDRQPDDNLVV